MIDEETLKEINRRQIEEARLFENYVKYGQEKDFVKASEFLWGSITNLAYAIGLTYGKKLTSHREVILFLREVVGKEYKTHINSAEALHANFYHGWMDEEVFMESVRKVEDLRMHLKDLLKSRLQKIIS